MNPNSTSLIPEICVNGGLFSTDFRVFTNIEKHIQGKDSYTTVDWQMLMLNLVVTPMVNFRIGTGGLLETYSGKIFNEHTASFDLYFKERFKWNVELRLTPDYQTGTLVRQEFNTSLHHIIYSHDKILISGFFKYLWADYYQTVMFNAFYVGVAMNID